MNMAKSAFIFPSSIAAWKLLSLPPSSPTGNSVCGLPVSSLCFAFSGLPIRAPMNVPHLSLILTGSIACSSFVFLRFFASSPDSDIKAFSFSFQVVSFVCMCGNRNNITLECGSSMTAYSFAIALCGIPIISSDLFVSGLMKITIFLCPIPHSSIFAVESHSSSCISCAVFIEFQ